MFISHFDSDHCGGIKEILEKLKVKNLVISKQAKKSEECNQIMKIANTKKVNIIFVDAGQKLKIDKDLFFSILWPNKEELISKNPLNNNSIVTKLIYGKFQMLFTGDIEEIAEKKIVEEYRKNLKATVLKIPHHGSKSSSTQEFLEAVLPKIALIGVRKRK